jgi:putative transposase
MSARNRTPSNIIGYGLYWYFLGLSFRNVAKALSFLLSVKISPVSIWNWIQKYKPRKYLKNKKIKEYSCIQKDETAIKASSSELIWLWVAIEPKDREILAISISKERNMFVAEHFLSDVVDEYGPHPVYTDGGSWYPQACRFLKLNHHIHSTFEKSLIERTMQYIKDRTMNALMIIFHAEKKRNVN